MNTDEINLLCYCQTETNDCTQVILNSHRSRNSFFRVCRVFFVLKFESHVRGIDVRKMKFRKNVSEESNIGTASSD